ncbi:MAG: flagellar biosynthetic protein FliR [bacterium]
MSPYSLTSAELNQWVGTFFWPFLRVGGMFMIAPVISGRQMPRQYRIALTFLVTFAVMPFIDAVPVVDPLSAESLLISMNQLLTGFAMGFIILLVINAVILAGENISMSMGMGFAVMSDPINGGQSAVVGQFFMVLASLLFLSFNGHLALIEMVAESFRVLPVSTQGIGTEGIWSLLVGVSHLFEGALAIALPAIAALLSVNLAMGIITRASPQLNIFSIGFPITMTVGFIVMNLSLPNFLPIFEHLLDNGFDAAKALFGGVP